MLKFRITIFFLFAMACMSGCSKDNSEYITIGALLPLTGGDFDEGHRALNGLQLAMQEINLNGGILGKKLDIIVLDDRDEEEHVVQQYKVLKEKGVAAIIGSSYSRVTMALAEAAEKDGIPIISPTASGSDITKGRKNVFRAIFIDDYQAEAMAKFASNSLNVKTAVVLYRRDNNSYKQAAEVFAKTFAKLGGQVMELEPYELEDEYKNILKKYAGNPPDAIYMPENYIPAADMVNAMFNVGLKKTYALGSDGWSGILTYVTNSEAAKKAYYTAPFSYDDRDSIVKRFVKNYFATFSQMPFASSSNAYSCVYILSEAIKKAGSTNRSNVVSAMKENELNTIIGRIKFDENNNPHPNVYVIQIKDGIYSTYEKLADGAFDAEKN